MVSWPSSLNRCQVVREAPSPHVSMVRPRVCRLGRWCVCVREGWQTPSGRTVLSPSSSRRIRSPCPSARLCCEHAAPCCEHAAPSNAARSRASVSTFGSPGSSTSSCSEASSRNRASRRGAGQSIVRRLLRRARRLPTPHPMTGPLRFAICCFWYAIFSGGCDGWNLFGHPFSSIPSLGRPLSSAANAHRHRRVPSVGRRFYRFSSV
jgi:hypothetical protein